MKKQFHLCHKDKDLKAENMSSIKNYTAKPHGGFWTSTFDEVYGSDWVQWILSQGYHNKDTVMEGYLITPKKDIRVYTIDSYEDSKKLIEEYGFVKDSFKDSFERLKKSDGEDTLHMFYVIDYEKMKEKYDCLQLTRKGFEDCHHRSRPFLSLVSGFDCESTIWFDWHFENIEYIEITPKAKKNWGI